MLRLFSIFFVVLILLVQVSFGFDAKNFKVKDSYTVGKTPLKVFTSGGVVNGKQKLHILCAGEDINYNDTIDNGDEKPSWWILDSPDGTPRKVLDFDRFFNYTSFRPGLDKANSIMYIALTNKIVSIDLIAEAIDDNDIADIDAQSIDFAGGHLLITVSGGTDKRGRLEVFNLQTSKILQTIPAGVNVQDCIYYQSPKGISIAILNQGAYGTDNSTVYYGAINHTFDFTLDDSVVVGNTANHIMYENGKLYVTVNMSHCIKVIDVNTHEVKTWNTGTVGWNGPRESYIKDDKLYLTTYSKDIRVFDINTGNLTGVYPFYGGFVFENLISWVDGLLVTSNPYNDSYIPNNSISTWDEEVIELLKSLREVTVGSQPLGMVLDSDKRLHVFCGGYDINNNGTVDAEDEPASWWTITRSGNGWMPEKREEMQFGDLKTPFRPAVDLINKTIYIPAKGVIKSFDLDKCKLFDDAVASYDAVALDMAGGHLMAAVNYPNKADSIVVINLETNSVLQKVYAGGDVKDLKYFPLMKKGIPQPVISLAILANDEGTQDSKLMYGEIKHMADFTLDNVVDAGKNGVKLSVFGNLLGVASYNSNDLTFVDAELNNSYNIKFGTMDGFGPMDLASVNEAGFIGGTLLGDLRPVRIEKKNDDDEFFGYSLSDFMPVGMPVESQIININQLNNEIFIAVTCKSINGILNNKVNIISSLVTSVQDYSTGKISQIMIYPNPTSDFLTIETELRENNNNLKIELVSMNGNKVCEYSVSAGNSLNYTIDIRKIGLSSGTYFARIINGNEIKSLPFNVVK
jgi:hypothetical protein